jgi:branched-chain amino acid transport system ATP-binding protein
VVLNGIALALKAGESLALLGPQRTGKTTLINTLVGVTRRPAGRLWLAGREITTLAAFRARRRRHRLGAAGAQHLQVAERRGEPDGSGAARPVDVKRVYEMFPRLAERRSNMGTQLSGGEQQMLAVARALVPQPEAAALDEPLEGLAPIIVRAAALDRARGARRGACRPSSSSRTRVSSSA